MLTSAPASPKPTASRLQILLMLLSRMRVSIWGSPSRRSLANFGPCMRTDMFHQQHIDCSSLQPWPATNEEQPFTRHIPSNSLH